MNNGVAPVAPEEEAIEEAAAPADETTEEAAA